MFNLQKFTLPLSLLTSMILITACGESTDEISAKDKVVILHSVGVTGCLFLEKYGNSKLEEQNVVKNTGYSSKSNSINCSTYAKARTDIYSYNDIDANIPECAELTFSEIQEAFPNEDLSFYENKNKSCVLSFDLK